MHPPFRRLLAATTVAALALAAACGDDDGNNDGASPSAAATPTTPAAAPMTPAAAPAPQAPAPAAAPAANAAATVAVVEKDFRIVPDPDTIAAGDITFAVENQDTDFHEFLVIRSDRALDDLPLTANGFQVDERAPELAVLGKASLNTGERATVQATLDAGTYLLICNQPGHYAAGMRTAFTVG